MILAVCFYLFNRHNWKRGKGGKKVHKKSYLYHRQNCLLSLLRLLDLEWLLKFDMDRSGWMSLTGIVLYGDLSASRVQSWRRRFRAPEQARNARRRRDVDAGHAESHNVFWWHGRIPWQSKASGAVGEWGYAGEWWARDEPPVINDNVMILIL